MSLPCCAVITKRVITPSSKMTADELHMMLSRIFCTWLVGNDSKHPRGSTMSGLNPQKQAEPQKQLRAVAGKALA
jgi:hypothetical protein